MQASAFQAALAGPAHRSVASITASASLKQESARTGRSAARKPRSSSTSSSNSAFFGGAPATFDASRTCLPERSHAAGFPQRTTTTASWRDSESYSFSSDVSPSRIKFLGGSSRSPSPIRRRRTSASPAQVFLDRARSASPERKVAEGIFDGRAQVEKATRNLVKLSYLNDHGRMKSITVAARTARAEPALRLPQSFSNAEVWAFHDPTSGRLLVCTSRWLHEHAGQRGVVPEWALRAASELGDVVYIAAGEPLAHEAFRALLEQTLVEV